MAITPIENGDPYRFAKAKQPRRVVRSDVLRPLSGKRRGLQAGAGIRGLTDRGLDSEQRRWWRTFEGDVDVFAMILKPAYLLPPWTLTEVEDGAGSESELELLRMFFHRPDGRLSCSAILWVTAVRLTALGEAYWLLRREVDPEDEEQIRKQKEESKRPGELLGTFAKQFQERFGKSPSLEIMHQAKERVETMAKQPIGFEWLQGAVKRKKDEPEVFVQVVGEFGKTAEFPASDIVEFMWPDPVRGGGLNLLKVLEPYSDTTVQIMVMNRDAARTGGMADLLLVVPGISRDERDRLEESMLDRADPARSDELFIPMVARQDVPFEDKPVQSAYSVELSKRGREMGWPDFDDRIMYRKSGVTGVPGALVGRYKDVNRSNMDAQRRELFEERVQPLCNMMSQEITEQIIIEQFGIESYEFGFEDVDLRTEEFAQKQDSERMREGVLTWAQRYEKEHGKKNLETMLERLEALGADPELLQSPMIYSGNKWLFLSDLAGEEEPEPAPVAGVAARQPALPPLPEEQGEGQPSNKVPEEAGDVAEAAKALDTWQRAATRALRETGFAEALNEAAVMRMYLAPDIWELTVERLERAEEPSDVSDAFAPLRAGVRSQEELLKLLQDEGDVAAQTLERGLQAVYADRRMRQALAMRNAAEAHPDAQVPFETATSE